MKDLVLARQIGNYNPSLSKTSNSFHCAARTAFFHARHEFIYLISLKFEFDLLQHGIRPCCCCLFVYHLMLRFRECTAAAWGKMSFFSSGYFLDGLATLRIYYQIKIIFSR